MTALVALCRTHPRETRDMTVRHLALLGLAVSHPGRSCEFFAAQLAVSKPVVSRACTFLAALGLLTTRRDADDKRFNVISVTAEGAALVAAANSERTDKT